MPSRTTTLHSDSAKQEHQGWGGDDGKRELEAETAAVTDAAAEKEATEGDATPAAEGETAAGAAGGDKQAETPAEPEDNSKSYEEYLAERKAAGRGILESLTSAGGRKANEGSDDSQWKDGVLLEKADDDVYFIGQQKVGGNTRGNSGVQGVALLMAQRRTMRESSLPKRPASFKTTLWPATARAAEIIS